MFRIRDDWHGRGGIGFDGSYTSRTRTDPATVNSKAGALQSVLSLSPSLSAAAGKTALLEILPLLLAVSAQSG